MCLAESGKNILQKRFEYAQNFLGNGSEGRDGLPRGHGVLPQLTQAHGTAATFRLNASGHGKLKPRRVNRVGTAGNTTMGIGHIDCRQSTNRKKYDNGNRTYSLPLEY